MDGLGALTGYYESLRGKVHFDRFELVNPLVQVVADAAILTFNYVSYAGQDGPSRWNCTEVYRRAGRNWEIVQSHWSYNCQACVTAVSVLARGARRPTTPQVPTRLPPPQVEPAACQPSQRS
jgi:hypothetical protein